MCACCARGDVLVRGAALVVLYVCCARARSWCVRPVFVVFPWWCGRDGVRVLFSCSACDVLTPSNKHNILDYFINNDYISISSNV